MDDAGGRRSRRPATSGRPGGGSGRQLCRSLPDDPCRHCTPTSRRPLTAQRVRERPRSPLRRRLRLDPP
jgi:hypothetical protein